MRSIKYLIIIVKEATKSKFKEKLLGRHVERKEEQIMVSVKGYYWFVCKWY